MTKQERIEFEEAWLEIENLITIIDPHFHPASNFKRPEECGPGELKLMLGFLRILVKLLLHDNESMKREQESLQILIDKQRK